MNILITSALASTAVVTFLALVAPRAESQAAPSAPTNPSPTAAAQDEDAPTELEALMGTLKTGQRNLRKLIRDPEANREALLKTLGKMEAAAHQAIPLTPHGAEAIEKDGLEAWTVGYKLKMTHLLAELLTMHDAALRSDATGLKAAYDAIGSTKKSGHERFRD